MSRFPFVRYPNGWFQVAYAAELPPGGVMPLQYFGRDLVLFRPEVAAGAPAGATPPPQLIDAHCPHMGAHLGHGGKVVGDSVRCPFHAWRFDGAGRCTAIPYAQKVPPRARVGSWTVREVNGLVMAWHHLEGAPPTWEVPTLPEHDNEEWTAYETRRWKIRTHNQEMAENAVDLAHFHYLHGTVEMPTAVAEARDHVLHATSTILMRTPMGKTSGTVDVHAYGFGFTTTRFRGIVETLLVSSATTIDDEYVDVRFSFTMKKLAHKDVTLTVGKHYIAEIERQLTQDIPIWENKIYVNPPLLVEGDGPIGLYRKWCRQFYSEPRATPSLPVVASA
jgi:phenylpropionate dioxygenase-like ring-hydroxylating dioxygenase large terminal subunit